MGRHDREVVVGSHAQQPADFWPPPRHDITSLHQEQQRLVSSHTISHNLNEYTLRPNTLFQGTAPTFANFPNGRGALISDAS